MILENYLIKDAAKLVEVEAHVLRYWEDELALPIQRNDLGHRFYTREDVEKFKEIKKMKDQGLQLKAIRMILKDGNINVIPENDKTNRMAIEVIETREEKMELHVDNKDEKVRRLQWLLQQMMREVLKENNQELSQEIKDSVVKELDYQFRIQEEKEEEKYKERSQREEEHFKKIDEMLRKKRSLFKK